MKENQQANMKKSILISLPILFLVGGLMHFVYELTGELDIVGAITPVNESPWEHLKLVFYPVLVWWIIFYFRAGKQEGFPKKKWMVSTAAAVLTAPLTIVLFFYSYTGAFGVEILVLDISSTLVAIAAGQWLAYHIYKYAKPGRFLSILSLAVVILLTCLFVICTFAAPHFPIFRDRNTGSYGI